MARNDSHTKASGHNLDPSTQMDDMDSVLVSE